MHPQPEVIDMGTNLKARGPPEQWLNALDKRLGERLRRATKQAHSVLTHFQSTSSECSESEASLFETLPLQVRHLTTLLIRSRFH